MNLGHDTKRCHGYTPSGEARPLAICRDCERYLCRTTAAKLTPWLKPEPPRVTVFDQVCVYRIPADH